LPQGTSFCPLPSSGALRVLPSQDRPVRPRDRRATPHIPNPDRCRATSAARKTEEEDIEGAGQFRVKEPSLRHLRGGLDADRWDGSLERAGAALGDRAGYDPLEKRKALYQLA